ncbi:unnamed protein product [Mytilus edulis]|uniref:Uncharacterized protein n=1 Tax=Mytilus edulis TaxID=6550 RepID=A0A8S3TS80_MYTED|nr:unnamed protein product [Mytilus edulis]
MQIRNVSILVVCAIYLVSGNPTAYSPEQVQKGIEVARNILRAAGKVRQKKRSGGDVQHDPVDDLCDAGNMALLNCAQVPLCEAASTFCTVKGATYLENILYLYTTINTNIDTVNGVDTVIFYAKVTMATVNVPSVSKKTLSTISVFDKNTVDIKVSHSSKNATVTYDNQTTNTGTNQFAEKPAGKIKGMISDLELM